MNRPTCVACSLKHLGQARALLLEVRKGYPQHWAYALGHMAEAEDELVEDYPSLAATIRAQRKVLEMHPDFVPPWGKLVVDIMAGTGYSISQEDTLHMKFNRWLKRWAPLMAVTFACSCLGGTIEQPDKTRTDAEISGIAATTVVEVATLATMLGLPNGDTSLSVEDGGVFLFTVVTNTVDVYVREVVGEGYNGPEKGTVFVNPAYDEEAVWTWDNNGFATLSAAANGPDVFAITDFSVGYQDGFVDPHGWNGAPGSQASAVYGPCVGSPILDWVPRTNYYRFYPGNSGITTNHTVAVNDVFHITNGVIKAITVAP